MYDALFRRLGAGEVARRAAREPRRRARPRPGGARRRRDRRLHDRRQPAQAVRDHLRYAARRRGGPRPRARRRRGRHVGGRQHPVVPHGRVRRRRRDPQAADDPGRGRARAAAHDRDRPALRPAQPLRPAADDRVAVAAAARHRRRRGHLRHRHRRGRPRGAARHRPRCGHDPRPAAAGHERLRGEAVRSPAGQRHHPPRPAGRRGVRPDDAGAAAAAPSGSRRRTPPSSPRPRPTCSRWPATSRPATAPRPLCGDVWPASARPARLSPPTPRPAGDAAEQDGASR